MTAQLWYVWNDAKERFVRARRPPKDACLAEALKKQLKIRLAGARDRQKLFEFQRECFETEPEIWLPGEADLQQVREGLKRWSPAQYPNELVIVAELKGRIIGLLLLVICYRFDNGCPSAWIEDIFVLKDFRGYKVATRLIEFAKKLAQRKGCEGLSLIVGLRNLAALRFYKKCGFRIKEIGRASLALKPTRK